MLEARVPDLLPTRAFHQWWLCLPSEPALLPGHAGPSACGSRHRLRLSVFRGKSLHPPVSQSDFTLASAFHQISLLRASLCVSGAQLFPLREGWVSLQSHLENSASSIFTMIASSITASSAPHARDLHGLLLTHGTPA